VFHIAPAFTSQRWLPQNWADDVLDGRISRTCLLGAVVLLGNGYWSKPWHLVNPKIAGKWMFIPLELIIIGFDPYPNVIFVGGEAMEHEQIHGISMEHG